MKAYGRSENRAPLILNVSTRCRYVERNALVVFTLRHELPVHNKWQVVWTAEPSGRVLQHEHPFSPFREYYNSSLIVQTAAWSLP